MGSVDHPVSGRRHNGCPANRALWIPPRGWGIGAVPVSMPSIQFGAEGGDRRGVARGPSAAPRPCQTQSGTPGRTGDGDARRTACAPTRRTASPGTALACNRGGITSHEPCPSMKRINFRNRPVCAGAGAHVVLNVRDGARPEDRLWGRARLASPVPRVLRRSAKRLPATARMSPAAGAIPVRLVRRDR